MRRTRLALGEVADLARGAMVWGEIAILDGFGGQGDYRQTGGSCDELVVGEDDGGIG